MRYARLLRRKPVMLLWAAQTLSVFGDRLYAMAIMWLAWKESGAQAMGLVAIAESVPYIVLGTVGRRVMPRFASLGRLAAVDVVRLVLVAALPLAWTAFGLPGMLAAAALLGVGGALFDPNLGALVPALVREDEVQPMAGLMDLTGRIARVAGPGTAGLLLTVVTKDALFWIDAATFAASAVALRLLSAAVVPRETPPRPGGPSARLRARELLRTHPPTAAAITVHGVGIFAQAAALAMPALLATRLHAGAGIYGLVLAATGAGSLAANAVAGNVKLPRALPVFYCGTWALSGLLLAATGQATSLPVLLALSALSGALAPFLQIALSTHLASFPPAARLRLLTVDQTLIRTCGTGSMLVLPALAAADPSAGFLSSGLALAVVASAGGALAVRWSRAHVTIPTSREPQLARD